MKHEKSLCACALFILVLSLIMFSNCAPQREIYAKYSLPPNSVLDFAPLRNLHIQSLNVRIRGNYRPLGQQSVFESYLRDRLAALIYKEHFYKMSDVIYRNYDGEKQLQSLLKGQHGYDLIHSHKPGSAKIYIKTAITINRTRGTDMVKTTLITLPYKTIYKNEHGNRVPYSKPNYAGQTVKTVSTRVPYEEVSANASLTISIKDKNGRLKYSRSFKNLKFKKKVGGGGDISAPPTALEVAGELFNSPLETIVADISPHREPRLLEVNENGDKSAVVLMKATAFSEAAMKLDAVIAKNEKKFREISAEISVEYGKKRGEAKKSPLKEAEKRAKVKKLESERKRALVEAGRFRSPDYENYAICMEVMGYIPDAIEFYNKACRADPENQTAKDSLIRVKELKNRIKHMGRQQKVKPRDEYKEKGHKER